ncbi:PEP-CTERM sorting domain-containing protein [Cerasicoccus fimbriatus]|uniref:PEP-CTERM sorting domain-containing protein n=1 Tax=Cerasicoccus fimbriatus TaxID=3014554 RepID=UPI0022B446C5|nr:PEP-CTERM sorting domain-containing protein [Cerasicoccus sp. TK19100]
MNTPRNIPLLTAAAILSGSITAQATDITWDGGGGDGLYLTPANWSTDTVPNLTGPDNAFLNASAQYDPGGDLLIQGGSTLTIQDGGNWEQINGIAWIKTQGGNLIIEEGGVFNTGTSQNMERDATTSITVNGTLIYGAAAGNFIYNPATFGSFSLASNANFSVGAEFQPAVDFTFNSGVTYTGGSVMAAQASDVVVTINGSDLTLVDNGPSVAGLYGFNGTTSYLDFTTAGGTITLSNVDSATEVETAINTGLYRYQGAIDPTNITFTDLGGGDYIISATTVPEPSTYALLLGTMTLSLLIIRRRK